MSNSNHQLISIIIINWNGLRWLQQCLNSLHQQTYKNFEIIFVDNASMDDSVGFVKNNFPNVKIIQNNQNYGFAKGNNIGIENAKGEFIILLNNDTWVETNFIEKMYYNFTTNDFDVIAPRFKSYDGKIQNRFVTTTIDLLGHPVTLKSDFEKNQNFFLYGVCLMLSKKTYKQTDGLDNDFFMYCEEIDLFWRLNLLKKKFAYIDHTFIHHAEAGSTGTGIKYNIFLWRNQNTLQMLLKNYSWYNLIWVLPIYLLQNIVEMLFFLIFGKLKIVLSYIQGWWFNLKSIKRILKKRKHIQSTRLISDYELMKKMYFGFGKVRHLISFIQH